MLFYAAIKIYEAKVSVLAFYSDDLRSNPAEIYSFSLQQCLKGTKP